MKHPTCVYQRDRDNFEFAMPPAHHNGVVHVYVLTAEEANTLLYELQHAVWARQGAGEVGS